jgi:hypothetical protein
MTDELQLQPAEVLELTPLTEYRVGTWLAKLPSGRVVRIKPLSLLDSVVMGHIPNTLLPAVQKLLNGDSAPLAAMETDLVANVEMIYWAVEAVMIFPRVWDGKGKQPAESITHAALSMEDHIALAGWAFSKVGAESPFLALCAE